MNKCYFGDVRTVLPALIGDGVRARMCVTSPPYYGLRDYGVDGQIGLEQTVEGYVEELVQVFRYVRDLLTDDGTLWLNLGDSYAGSGGIGSQYDSWEKGQPTKFVNPTRKRVQSTNYHKVSQAAIACSLKAGPEVGLSGKNLIGVPWRVAFALQADGWILRSDIIWHKPNPMPEPVEDRPTKSHEYLFLFAKQTTYYYDAEAIKERGVVPAGTRGAKGSKARMGESGVNARPAEAWDYRGTRNKRDVWTVQTRPYPEAHFAVFPEELITPCILAGSAPSDVVLDPFFGSGTTGAVCQRLGRKWVGVELNRDYEPIINKRTAQGGLF